MPRFSMSSQERLDTADLRLQKVFRVVISRIDCIIIEGYRSSDRQELLFSQGKSKKRGGQSKHNNKPSLAIDAAPYYRDKPHIRWANKYELLKLIGKGKQVEAFKMICSLMRWYYFAGIVMATAMSMGVNLRWGGDWNSNTEFGDQSFDDLCHFEIKR